MKPLFDRDHKARIDTAPNLEQPEIAYLHPERRSPAFRENVAAFLRSTTGTTFSKLRNAAFISFAIMVLLPMAVASIYYGFIASNQYVAEFRFTVKDASPRGVSPANSLVSLFGGLSGSNTYDNYLIVDYLKSRYAVEQLAKRINVIPRYTSGEIDWFSRYNASLPVERFVTYWQGKINARYDQITGLAVAEVHAFTPQDAFLIANTLVTIAEELVNQIANRSQIDAVRFAESEVQRAEERLRGTRTKLTEYRNRMGLIDPVASVAASNATLIQTLRASLAQMETQLAALTRQNLEPTSPTITVLNNQIRSTRDQLQKVEGTVGHDTNGVALSAVMAEYEKLDLERQFAQTLLTGAVQALDSARASAATQHLYITPYVRPSLPESSVYPRRMISVLLVGLLAFFIWIAAFLLTRSIRERFS